MPCHVQCSPAEPHKRRQKTGRQEEEEETHKTRICVRADAAGALALVAAGLLAGAAAPAAPGEREPREDHNDRGHQEQNQTPDRKPSHPNEYSIHNMCAEHVLVYTSSTNCTASYGVALEKIL